MASSASSPAIGRATATGGRCEDATSRSVVMPRSTSTAASTLPLQLSRTACSVSGSTSGNMAIRLSIITSEMLITALLSAPAVDGAHEKAHENAKLPTSHLPWNFVSEPFKTYEGICVNQSAL